MYFVEVLECSQAPDYPLTLRVGDGVEPGTVIRYTCEDGAVFHPDSQMTTLVIRCSAGVWQPPPSGCKGMQ